MSLAFMDKIQVFMVTNIKSPNSKMQLKEISELFYFSVIQLVQNIFTTNMHTKKSFINPFLKVKIIIILLLDH